MVQRGDGIGQASRKWMFGRQPVIHRDHPAAGLVAEPAAQPIMGFKTAGHPAAAMEEQHPGQHPRWLAQRRIDAQRNMARAAMTFMNRHQVIAHAADFHRGRRVHQIGQIDQGGAALFHIAIAATGLARGSQHLQKTAGMSVQRHGYFPSGCFWRSIRPLSA